MKALILAAGLGTRLKPITDNIPKALVEVNGTPILRHLILTLKRHGADEIVVNVHHFADKIKEFLKGNDFGVEISISDETDELLDTGGGIVKAMPLLFSKNDQPVLIHNVDIISNADLKELMDSSFNGHPNYNGSSLLISERESTRKLIFNSELKLRGWHDLKTDKYRKVGNEEKVLKEYSFSGIYAMSRESIEEMKQLMGTGKFSVMEYFLNPLRKIDVRGVSQTNLKLLDIGKPATLLQAPALLNEVNVFS